MEWFEALILGLIQGLTEYLPVSSSGHLAIGSALFGIQGEENLAFTVVVHVATVFSTMVVLWKEIEWIFKGLFKFQMNDETRYVINILISMVPIGIVGVFFKDEVEAVFGSGLLIVGCMLLVTAALLSFSYYYKPLGWTSFKVVGHARYHICRRMKVKKLKVGHAGTLDPLATGVMIVCTGKATKRIEEFQYHTKEYVATIQLGATTPSYDLEHEIDATYPTEHITRELVEETLKTFIGEIQQVPPAFSACMVNGKRAYDLARKGEEVELKPKLLVIDEIELLECNLPEIKIRVVCSKGTYIRALARDIGEALNSGAHLTALERTRVGDVRLEDCLDPMDFKEWIDAQEIETEE